MEATIENQAGAAGTTFDIQRIMEMIPHRYPFLMIDRVIDAGSFFEIKRLFAAEIIVGVARIGGRAVTIIKGEIVV